ncbi:TetR family transcriptional regulator [Actinomadura darangshiensis]|uniref:TetR family transcriptional regulator n=1 Tax=Actinomadura darangshiensis TaxID=705336 RepID=A0A4R5BYX5_9ACTN|nr:TetR family transcriptional regulator [Actinomadura darangshiensis]TDD91096.1 TetR family transcriptional regulator [Actinomadura darangshiensis]
MPVKSRRAEYKELTRGAVLQAAARLFAERGFAATTIDDVAEAARVSKGSVYYHFADKARLFEAVFTDGQSRLVETVATAAARHDAPWDQLIAALDAYMDGTVADPAHRTLLQQAPTALGVERCRELDAEMGLPAVRALLENLAATGELAVDSIDMLTLLLFSALCEAALTAGAAPDPPRARDEATTVLKAIMTGLHRPPA